MPFIAFPGHAGRLLLVTPLALRSLASDDAVDAEFSAFLVVAGAPR